MSQLNTTTYYRAREERERGLAQIARDPQIAAIHRDLATRYAVLAVQAAMDGLPSMRAR